MIHEIGQGRFDNHYRVVEPTPADFLLHFSVGGCLVRQAGATTVDLPRVSDYKNQPELVVFLFSIDSTRFFLDLDDAAEVGEGFAYQPLAWARRLGPQDLAFACVTASHLDRWYRDNRYCSRCAHPMELAPRSRELVCPACAKVVYPKISPAVICAVTCCDGNDDKLLLTRYAGRTTALLALVAGYAEVGEPLEDTVRREVMEEVGLTVGDPHYYKSQPWSFTDSLLVGFWCEVIGDPTIRVDKTELKEARWFARGEIPPERGRDTTSLTAEMIERFRLFGRAAW